MKKLIDIIGMCLVIMIFSCANLWAEEISTSVMMRNDWIKSENKESVQAQEFYAYWLYDKGIGGGIDVITIPEADAISVKPFGTWKLSDSVHFVGGAMTTSYGSDYLQAGVWIFQNFGNWKLFADFREYVEISGKRSDFMDDFIEITYPVIPNKLTLGVVSMYDRWWQDDNHDWFFIGPVGYYHLSKTVTLFCRPSCDWERNSGETVRTAKIRVGVKFVF